MCSSPMVAFTIAALLLLAVAMATEYMVGDRRGWNHRVNYAEWAAGKEFHVGDTLVFQYQSEKYNVIKVNAGNSKDCVADGDVLATGHDTVTLSSEGKKWYICGVARHCADYGQKLVIDVVDITGARSPPPVPANTSTTPNAACGVVSSWYPIFTAIMVAGAVIFF